MRVCENNLEHCKSRSMGRNVHARGFNQVTARWQCILDVALRRDDRIRSAYASSHDPWACECCTMQRPRGGIFASRGEFSAHEGADPRHRVTTKSAYNIRQPATTPRRGRCRAALSLGDCHGIGERGDSAPTLLAAPQTCCRHRDGSAPSSATAADNGLQR
jgi:hypothetical protein